MYSSCNLPDYNQEIIFHQIKFDYLIISSLLEKCSACGSNESESTMFTINPEGRTEVAYRRCKKCRSYFNPEPYTIGNEINHAKFTSYGLVETGKELANLKSNLYDSILKLIHRYCPPPANLLDVGCSFGGFLIRAQLRGYKVFGIDIIPEAVDYVREIGIQAQVSYSIIDEPFFQNGEVDIISILDTNYYFPDQAYEFNNAYKKLNLGGYLILRVVDKSWLYSIGLTVAKVSTHLGRKLVQRAINDHLFSMPVKSLLKLLQSRGFNIIYASPRGALYSVHSALSVKMAFVVGYLIWSITGAYLAPGCLIIAKKT